MYVGLDREYALLWSGSTDSTDSTDSTTLLEFPRRVIEKYSNIKFHKNPSSGSCVPCRHLDGRMDGGTDR